MLQELIYAESSSWSQREQASSLEGFINILIFCSHLNTCADIELFEVLQAGRGAKQSGHTGKWGQLTDPSKCDVRGLVKVHINSAPCVPVTKHINGEYIASLVCSLP